jgi:hypothetical protein
MKTDGQDIANNKKSDQEEFEYKGNIPKN